MEPIPGKTLRTALALALAVALSACVKRQETSTPTSSPSQDTAGNQYQDPSVEFPIDEAPKAAKVSGNPFAGVKLWVDPESLSMLRANAIRAKEPEKAKT